ncbi:MAG TPA: response regulator, partial [Bryobacteraceae bacterium]
DNASNQQVALAILQKLGYRADVVANGLEALESLRSLPYDLVLMDCQMPEMNGYQATERIRDPQSGVRNPKIPIVALTAHAMKGDREKCLGAGMNDYISKPVSPLTLDAVLKKWSPQDAEASLAPPGGDPPVTSTAPARKDEKSPPVFDEASLVERLMGDRNLAGVIVGRFLDDIPMQLAALSSHLSEGDIEGSSRVAHAIRGAAANVGGDALRATALEMETAGKAGDFHAMLTRLPHLMEQFGALKEVMEVVKTGLKS